MAEKAISREDIERTRFWLTEFGKDWIGEVPIRIHKKEYGGLGAPEFSDEFVGYVGELVCKEPTCTICLERRLPPKHAITSESYRLAHKAPARNRTTKALRRLRRVAPLEFDVLFLIVMHGLSVSEVAKKLTDRSRTRGLDEVFDTDSVTILTVSGVEKVASWF